MSKRPLTFLCISSYFKGEDFLRYCKKEGNKVFLITSENLKNEPWPWDSIDDTFYLHEDKDQQWNMKDLIGGLAYLMQSNKIDRVVALDDFDVEKAAHVREHFRIPGMGQTTVRYFRDKLAMRVKAETEGIPVPAFSPLFNDDEVNDYIKRVSPPWMIKPRAEASATGIKKVDSADELWKVIHSLGENRHNYLVEQFKPGAVYHVDALTVDGKVQFARASQYLNTPMEVAHGGGIFRSTTIEFGSKEDKALQRLNAKVMKAFGMQFSASHTEFIRCDDDGKFYFLETSSRVGGAHLAEMVEMSSGINLWGEWARIETAMAKGKAYKLPRVRKDYAGIVVSLSRFQHPDDSSFEDAEICWKLEKDYHIGMIVKSKKRERVLELLVDYARRIGRDFHASVAAPDAKKMI